MKRHEHLPRLTAAHYRGFGAIHWSLSVVGRATGWLTPLFHARFREIVLHTCIRYDVLCPMYCLMPDHAHLLLRGISHEADQREGMRLLKRFANALLEPRRFQKQPYDHVLRREDLEREAFRAVAFYIAENPVRAGLCERAEDYAFSGAVLPGFPDLNVHDVRYWDIFWAEHERLLQRNDYVG